MKDGVFPLLDNGVADSLGLWKPHVVHVELNYTL